MAVVAGISAVMWVTADRRSMRRGPAHPPAPIASAAVTTQVIPLPTFPIRNAAADALLAAASVAAVEQNGSQSGKEQKLGPDGHPMPVGADHPGEAAAFRRLSLISEDGEIAENGLMNAAQQVREMRAAAPPEADAGAGISRGTWSWIGPGNIGGRVRSLLMHPTAPGTMWAGGVDGGIWKTTTGGDTWTPVEDFMANLAVSTMALSPTNSSVMYAGTGEGFYNGDAIRGAGIFKSTDGGNTWAQLPSTANDAFHYVNRIAISPDGSTILAATGRTATRGIKRSTDGGTTWADVNSQLFEATDVNFHPTDSLRAVASGYDGDASYSTDGGVTWTLATGMPLGSFDRVEISYAPSSPNIVYASVDASGGQLYVSVDGGGSYALRFNGAPDYLSGQGWYDNALWVNPNDPNFIIVGGVDLYKSLDGGLTFVRISNWAAAPASAHADHHVIVNHPDFNNTTNKIVYFGNDGGVYRTTDVSTVGGGGSLNCPGACSTGWTALNNNLGVTQFYGGAGHAASGVLIGGTQDNGSLKYTAAGGVNGWTTTFGGDGGYSAIAPNNGNYLFGEYVYLALHRSLNGGASSDWINGLYWNGVSYECKAAPYRIGDPGVDGCSPSSFSTGANFIAPFILDPNNPDRLLAGGLRLFRTNDASTPNTAATGPAWAAIKASIGSNISAIAVSKVNSDVIWVGHNNGNVYSTSNGTQASPTWTQRDLGTPALPNRMVTRITIDPTDSNIVYVAFGGFNANNLWRTLDGGVNWTQVTGAGLTSLPAAPIRDLEINPANSNWLYAATEVGIFASETAGASWMLPHDGPANVSVDELFFMGGHLVAVTHGRGMFRHPVTVDPSVPSLNVSSATVAAGSPVTVSLNNGLGGAQDWMAVAQATAPDTSYLFFTYVGPGVTSRTWTFNAPAAAGQYEVRLFQNNGFTRLATSPVFAVMPGLAINDVSIAEGQSGTTIANFTVSLSGSSAQTVTVDFATSDGSGTAGSDYVATSGSLNFSPGSLTRTIPVTVNGDTDFEPSETFGITLSGAVNAIISDGNGLGTILGDDSGPTLTVNDVSVMEGDAGTTNAIFTVTLLPAAPGNVTVDYLTVNGTASSPSDYVSQTGTLVFAPGQQTQTITIVVNGDLLTEANETFFVDLVNASSNAAIGDARGVGTITNDEGPRLTVDLTTVTTGTPVTATLTNGPAGAQDWITLARVGAPEQSYGAWVYVGAGVTTRTWTVPMPPTPGQYEFRLYPNNTFNRIATSAPITVLPGMIINDPTIAEGNDGTTNLVFTVTLSAPNPNPVSVQFASGNGTATPDVDFTPSSGTLSFAANQTARTISVPILGDTTFEPSESFAMILSNAVNALITDAQSVGTISNSRRRI